MLGSGTSGDPYQIATFADLEQLNVKLAEQYKYWKLTADIDASPTADPGYNSGAGWLPVGTSSTPWMSYFDGNNHTISGLYINRPTTDYVGLFGNARGNNTYMKNVNFVDCNVTGQTYVGTFIGWYGSWNIRKVGYIQNVHTTNCDVAGATDIGNIIGLINPMAGTIYISDMIATGSVTATGSRVGGIIGFASYDGTNDISNLTVDGNNLTFSVSSSSDDVGGLFGQIQKSSMTNCHTTNIYISGARDNVGGFAGSHYRSGTITRCYAHKVNVSGRNNVGGFFGYSNPFNQIITWNECYSAGTVQGTGTYIGGFVGMSTQAGSNKPTNCYSTCNVSTTGSVVGGFIGYAQACQMNKCYSKGSVSGTTPGGFAAQDGGYSSSATDCFWDTQTSGQETSALGTGKTTAEMKTESTYTNWDFSTPIWIIETYPNEGYPFLLSPPLYNIISETETTSGVDEPSIGGQPDSVLVEDNGEDSETAVWAGTMSLLLNDSGCLIDYQELHISTDVTDSANHNDNINIQNNLITSDIVTDNELLSLQNYLNVLDSGAISEIPNLKNHLTLQDDLLGITNIYPIHNFLEVLESNTILESLHVALETVVNDDGFSNELVEVFIRLMLLESAFGDDNITLTVYTLLSDYGSASEAVRKELIKVIGSLVFIKQKSIELEFTNEKTFDVER